LNIPDGVLITQFFELSNVRCLIDDYLKEHDSTIEDAPVLYDTIITTIDDISKLVIKEAKKEKETNTKMVLIDGEYIFISQVSVLRSYCEKIKLSLEETPIRNTFSLKYVKAIKIKRTEEKQKEREQEIQEANANLIHQGKMLVYTAADQEY
jgi:hypothetical protein